MKLSLGRAMVLLTAAATVQIGIVAYGFLSKGPGTPGAVLSIGDTLRVLAGPKTDGKPTIVRLGTGAVTVLYAFHTECAHCLKVASKWAPNPQAFWNLHASLLSRTPWVFVFDPDGVLRYHGHGNDMEGLAESVRAVQNNAVPTQLQGVQ